MRTLEPRELLTTLLVAGASLVISLLARGRELASFSLLLTIWVVADGLRGRWTWDGQGLRLDNLLSELRRNASLVVLVGVVLQVAFWLVARFVYPPLWAQVQGRIAVMRAWPLVALLAFVTLEALSEEIAFRSFLQGRLALALRMFWALLFAALLHAGFHWQVNVNVATTGLDSLFVVLDSGIYGWVYARSRNVIVAWLAHLLADMMSLAFLL